MSANTYPLERAKGRIARGAPMATPIRTKLAELLDTIDAYLQSDGGAVPEGEMTPELAAMRDTFRDAVGMLAHPAGGSCSCGHPQEVDH